MPALGAYDLLYPLGEGGMGVVWVGEHRMIGRRAAIKILHDTLARDRDLIARFFNEARAAAAIGDPGIVQVFDFGKTDDGTVYIVMELLDGESLQARMRRTGPLAVADACRLVRQVAASLAVAHARGIIHRDLKPENVFVVRDPEVPGGERAKILDFGIAKLGIGEAGVKTHTHALMGTPAFMSPEQCRGAGQVDLRADIYSLGCMLFMLVTGAPPFRAEGAGDLIAMHLRETPPVPSGVVRDVPAAFDEVVARCLAKAPADRFATCDELARALAALELPRMRAERSRAASQPIAVVAAGMPTTLSVASAQVAAPPQRRSPAIAIGLAVAIVASALVGSFATRAERVIDVPASGVATDASTDAPPIAHDAAVADSPAVIADAAPRLDAPSMDAPAVVAPATPRMSAPPRPSPAPPPRPVTAIAPRVDAAVPPPPVAPSPPANPSVELDSSGLPLTR